MKKSLALILLALSMTAKADELHSYNDVKLAIQSGKRLSILIDFSQCTANGNKSAMNIIGVLTPNEMMINKDKEYITSSVFHFTLSHPAYPKKGIYEFSKITFNNNNDFTYSVQVVDPTNYQPLNDAITFSCRIGTGVKVQTG